MPLHGLPSGPSTIVLGATAELEVAAPGAAGGNASAAAVSVGAIGEAGSHVEVQDESHFHGELHCQLDDCSPHGCCGDVSCQFHAILAAELMGNAGVGCASRAALD